MMDRPPKKPPFKIGTRLRYIGDSKTGYGCSKCKKHYDYEKFMEIYTPVKAPGLEVTVVEHRPGRQGTLRHWEDEDGPAYDDLGEPVLDRTDDAYCLYQVKAVCCGRLMYGPTIDDENKNEWEVIK